ncbi:MAG: FAD-dependent oxidoreductase [SAR324 cluster bacterium]|nr:FAD-dependent oxidoreductase [SAR324 cluster bacterium]
MAIVVRKIKRPVRAHIGGGKKSQSTKLPRYVAKMPPCADTCPSSEDIRGYLTYIAQSEEYGRTFEESMEQAWYMLTDKNPMPAVMGRVCPHPCESACNRKDKDSAVSINKVELSIGQFGLEKNLALKVLTKEKTGKKIAVIGSGPSGISCAYQLARKGHSVTVFESKSEPGGMIRWGIPAYRLPRKIIQAEYQRIFDLGVDFKPNTKVGKDISLDQLKSDFDAIYNAIGAQVGWSLGLVGEDSSNVYTGVEFLYKHNMQEAMNIGNKVIVVGGGDTAMDVARSCKRMGADVTIVYRRSRNEMPAIAEDIVGAEEEGINFNFLCTPTKLQVADGKVTGMACVRMVLGEPDESGRASFSVVAGSDFDISATSLIPSISQEADFEGMEELKNAKNWTSTATDFGRVTETGKIWAGGDVTRALGLVTEAVGDGRLAAEDMDRFLMGIEYKKPDAMPVISSATMHMQHYPDAARNFISEKPGAERISNFDEYIIPFDIDAIKAEAARCMSCGQCYDCENCWKFCGDGAVNKLPKGQHFEFNLDKCIGCSKCMEECPCGLIDMI